MLAIAQEKARIPAIPKALVSRDPRGVSQKNDVQTDSWHLSRDSAFLLLSLSPFFPRFPISSAQRKGRDTMPMRHRIPARIV